MQQARPMPQAAAERTLAAANPAPSLREERLGLVLVALAALFWSFGGTIARFVETPDSWTIVFWRSVWAATFILGYMLWRDGARGTLAMVMRMGLPGLLVAACFATASTSFVVALGYTTVANIVLINAGVPLIAALIGWIVFRQRVSGATWVAIVAVILGVAIMVSGSVSGSVSPVGTALALLIAFAFATATVVTCHYSHVRMTPAMCLGVMMAGAFASTQASGLSVTATDMGWLFAFGALNLGLGLALFASGARLVPAAYAALLGTLETVLSPVWVWLVHSEVPGATTLAGGAIVFMALLLHIGLEFRRQAPQRPGVTGMPGPR
jgi:drug/metabolite transporter (DMT)-like permease